ncbi:MAG: hypothetical protein U0R44_01930 [Candidatus Micrarchaeia archaeon]
MVGLRSFIIKKAASLFFAGLAIILFYSSWVSYSESYSYLVLVLIASAFVSLAAAAFLYKSKD